MSTTKLKVIFHFFNFICLLFHIKFLQKVPTNRFWVTAKKRAKHSTVSALEVLRKGSIFSNTVVIQTHSCTAPIDMKIYYTISHFLLAKWFLFGGFRYWKVIRFIYANIAKDYIYTHARTLLYIHLQIYMNTPCCHSTLTRIYKSQRWLYLCMLNVSEQTGMKDKWYVWCGDRYFPHFMPQCLEQSMWFLENIQSNSCHTAPNTVHTYPYMHGLCLDFEHMCPMEILNVVFFLLSHYEFFFYF